MWTRIADGLPFLGANVWVAYTNGEDKALSLVVFDGSFHTPVGVTVVAWMLVTTPRFPYGEEETQLDHCEICGNLVMMTGIGYWEYTDRGITSHTAYPK